MNLICFDVCLPCLLCSLSFRLSKQSWICLFVPFFFHTPVVFFCGRKTFRCMFKRKNSCSLTRLHYSIFPAPALIISVLCIYVSLCSRISIVWLCSFLVLSVYPPLSQSITILASAGAQKVSVVLLNGRSEMGMCPPDSNDFIREQ